jgi:transposase
MESYKIAGIDVHKNMLAVVVSDVTVNGMTFERRKFGATDTELQLLAQWLGEKCVREVVMESTAQYWKPVWRTLEPHFKLHLAQAQSNRGPSGRKRDFQDAERLVRRLVAGELILSFVPDAEQRLWRLITRTRGQLIGDRVRLRNQLEGFLEDAHLKLHCKVSDVFGVSSWRILKALASGETDAARLAELATPELKATAEELQDVLGAAASLSDLHRQMLGLFLSHAELLDQQIEALQKSAGKAMQQHSEAVTRLSKTPGYGVDSALQVIAEVGPAAATFPSAEQMSSWVGACPGLEESAGESKSNRCPKGNRQMRKVLTQVARCAVRTKGSIFQIKYERLVPRLGDKKAIWAIVHHLCRVTWKILHQGVEYEERGRPPEPKRAKERSARQRRELRKLGYPVPATPALTRVRA